MNSATWVKFLAGVLLFAAWLSLVLMRIVPPGPLVDAIGYALVGLGIYHASTSSAPTAVAGVASLFDPLEPVAKPLPVSTSAPAPQPAAVPAPATLQAAAPAAVQ